VLCSSKTQPLSRDSLFSLIPANARLGPIGLCGVLPVFHMPFFGAPIMNTITLDNDKTELIAFLKTLRAPQ